MSESLLCPNCGATLPIGGLCGACAAAFLQGDPTVAPGGPFVPPTVAELAEQFPQLEIFELVGRGGMGAVYRVRQLELDRVVALKILPPDIGGDPAFAERFAREARALAKLSHPNIVTLFEYGRAGNGPYFFLMEFVDGVNLRQLLLSERVSPREALEIVPQICDALQFAHDHGIVHRDIKPENILLDRRGRVKVADFGLAKLMGAGAGVAGEGTEARGKLTGVGKILGTPSYMAPEQIAEPDAVDHRADIYALGVVFYQLLTGELAGRPLEPPSRRVCVDVRLDEIVLRALETDPDRRYAQASAMKTRVEEAIPPVARKPSRRWIAGSFVGAVCLAAVGAAVALRGGGSPFAKMSESDAAATSPNDVAAESAPRTATATWLARMDDGDYGQAWQDAAVSFQRAISQVDWVAKSKEIRRPLGAVRSRKWGIAERRTDSPGMPDGSYFTATFQTSFANLSEATESVAFGLDPEGRWRALSYLIRPRVDFEGMPANSAPPATDAGRAAVAAAESWLAGIDAEKYAESWPVASAAFRKAVTQPQWAAALEKVRRPLGTVERRTWRAAREEANLPGAPVGEYVVMRFDTSFSNKKTSVETVTFSRAANGAWEASGYFVK